MYLPSFLRIVDCKAAGLNTKTSANGQQLRMGLSIRKCFFKNYAPHISLEGKIDSRLVSDVQTSPTYILTLKDKRKWSVGGGAQLHLLSNLSIKGIFSVKDYFL